MCKRKQSSEMSSAAKNGGKEQNFFSRKIKLVDLFFGLFLVFIVPLVLCEPDRSKYLTYENIYNSTKYAQLQSSRRPLPHNISFINPVHKYFKDNVRDTSNRNHGNYTNDVEFEGFNPHVKFKKERDKSKGKLLVGFSHDPYRISIPEADYAKGMRQPDPNAMKLDTRGKRGVSHLYNMIYCATGCDPLIYKGYGCYCGFLGSGRYADGIDRCCKMHDECYENIYCPFYTVYFQPYYWKCYHNEPLCALENQLQSERVINGCAARLCDCDRRLAMCLRRYGCPRRRALCHSSPLRLLQNVLMPY